MPSQPALYQPSGSTIDGATYTVDNGGNRTGRTPQPSGTASNYTYDAIYELTGVTQGANTTESYTYDPVGNRLSSLGVASYTNNTSNELTSTSNATYTYDYNGNTTSKTDSTGTTNYTWDFENRLTSVTLPGGGGTISFAYDPFGRRIKKVTPSATSVFAYDGDNLIEETNASGAAVVRYSQTQNIDEPLAMLRSGATSYYHADGLGSVTSLSNGGGSLAQTYTFDSFGKQTASSGSLTNPFRYTARESDTETGLYYYRARYYDQTTGRFLSEDPIGHRGGLNFYAYVSNDATDLVDPQGLLKVCCRSANVEPAQKWADLTLRPPACHCFLRLSDGTTLGGYFSLGFLVKRKNDEHDKGKYYPRPANCTDVPGKACENDARAKKAFDAYPKIPGTYGFDRGDSGTSNAVAASLLKDAGFDGTLPSCAWGQKAPDPSDPNTPLGPKGWIKLFFIW